MHVHYMLLEWCNLWLSNPIPNRLNTQLVEHTWLSLAAKYCMLVHHANEPLANEPLTEVSCLTLTQKDKVIHTTGMWAQRICNYRYYLVPPRARVRVTQVVYPVRFCNPLHGADGSRSGQIRILWWFKFCRKFWCMKPMHMKYNGPKFEQETQGMSGFHFRGGGVNRAPKNGGGGVREKGSIDRHHQPVIMKSGAKGAENFFEH